MIDGNLRVSDLGEKKLIKRIIAKSNSYESSNSNNYIGDDAAIIDFHQNSKKTQDSYLIASSDMLIESQHFPKKMSYFQMGWKAVTVNVSDLAAMGAIPTGFLLNIAIPTQTKLSDFDKIIDGVLDACSYYNIPLIGGDTNQANEIIISGTALGKTEKNKVLRKNEFKKGDLIASTGKLGLSALGFELLENPSLLEIREIREKKETVETVETIEIIETKEIKKSEDINSNLIDLAIKKILKPIAKLKEGIILNKENLASSATDITDGLASELYELYEADKIANPNSSLGIKIYEENLKNSEFYKLAKAIDKDPLDLILHFGEDFELLFTFNKNNLDRVKNIDIDTDSISSINFINPDNNDSNFNNDFYVIGEINDSNKVEIELSNGNIEEVSSKGYEHFIHKDNK